MKIIKRKSHADVSYEDSIAKAKQAQARERDAVYQQTGLRIAEDGRPVLEKKDADIDPKRTAVSA